VRQLRRQPGKLALLYGQGEFVTKHHALVLAAAAPDEHRLTPDYSVQSMADRNRGDIPPLIATHAGPATVETFTVI
jgi:acetyl-CoA C-acetyltransferase